MDLLIACLVLCLILTLVLYVIDLLPLPLTSSPFPIWNILKILAVLIAVIWLVQRFGLLR